MSLSYYPLRGMTKQISSILKITVALSLITLLTGCATEQVFNKTINTWQNETITEFMDVWHIRPTRHEIISPTRKLFVFNRIQRYHSPGTYLPGNCYGYGSRYGYGYRSRFTSCSPGIYYPASSYVTRCLIRIYTNNNGMIEHINYRGGGCILSPHEQRDLIYSPMHAIDHA